MNYKEAIALKQAVHHKFDGFDPTKMVRDKKYTVTQLAVPWDASFEFDDYMQNTPNRI